jgi:hypothetical protein
MANHTRKPFFPSYMLGGSYHRNLSSPHLNIVPIAFCKLTRRNGNNWSNLPSIK